jgi:hypothetical protein
MPGTLKLLAGEGFCSVFVSLAKRALLRGDTCVGRRDYGQDEDDEYAKVLARYTRRTITNAVAFLWPTHIRG